MADILSGIPVGPWVVFRDQDGKGVGHILEALQRLRQVSLCDEISDDVDDATVIRNSVRLELALQALDQIYARGERALLLSTAWL